MRTITNDYHDAQVLNLGSAAEAGPYLVTQTGVSPTAVVPKTFMFVLRPDGQWVNFHAYAAQGKPEAMDEIVFPSMNEVRATFSKLFGRARVFDMPIDKERLQGWLERHEGGDPLKAAHAWAIEYRQRQREQRK
jgi:hypothetical protein